MQAGLSEIKAHDGGHACKDNLNVAL